MVFRLVTFAGRWLFLLGQPSAVACLVRLAVAHLESVLLGEPVRARADEHDVRGFFHHQPCGGNGVHDALDPSNAAGLVAWAVHDAGVELHDTSGIGLAAEADRCVAGRLHQTHTLLDGVERGAAAL